MDAHHSADEFVFGNCVRCHGLVRVPVTTRATTLVRCPRCQESFPLAEILDQEIPALEIVEERQTERHSSFSIETSKSNVSRKPVERAVKTDDGRYVVPPQLAKAAMSRRHRSSRPVAVVEREPSDVAGESSRSRHERIRRRRRDKSFSKHHRERSTMLDVVMVILGGCLSVPVAQLLVWWLIGADPLGLAPHTAKFAPVLVPAALRGMEELDNGEPAEDVGESDADSRDSREGAKSDTEAGANSTSNANSETVVDIAGDAFLNPMSQAASCWGSQAMPVGSRSTLLNMPMFRVQDSGVQDSVFV